MQTKLSAFAGRVIEAGWLAALIIVPLLFNIYTERVFEEDKIPLMRSIALVIFVALLVWAVERGRAALRIGERPWWEIPLVVPALVLVGAYLLSTAFSIVPRVSFWGAYIRRQGTYTWLSYVTIFFGVLFMARHPKQVTRIVTVLLLASVPATLYAFIQNRGLDPLPWGGDVVRRVSSTAGNPIFISAYLIMVVPFTLMRVIEHFRELMRPSEGEEGDDPNYLASALLAGAYLFLLAIQLMTIVFSQSRGPLLGLLAGLGLFALLTLIPRSRWLTLATVGLAVAGVTFLALFNLPNSPLEPLREVRYLGRLGRVFEVSEGTGLVRALIWQGSADLLAADPPRDIVGYGPEAMYVAYNRYYPPELAQVELRNASPDRAHNETFDALIMTGVIGFAAQLFLFLSIFYYVLKWLGLIHTERQRAIFIGLMVVAGGAGVLLPYFLDGSLRFAGVGLPAGIALGLATYVLGYALTHLGGSQRPQHPQSLLLIALLAAILGHFIEVHFGIAIGVTRLYFWLYAALAVVVGYPLLTGVVTPGEVEEAGEEEPSRRSRRRRREERVRRASQPLLSGTLVGLSLMAGLVLVVMTFDFYRPDMNIWDNSGVLVWLFLGTWLFGMLVVCAEAAFEQDEAGAWLPRLLVYGGISLGTWSLFALFYIPWVNGQALAGSVSIEQLAEASSRLANTITIIYLYTFALMGLTAFALLREEAPARAVTAAPPWAPPLYGLALVAIIPVIVITNLNVSRADVFSKQGSGYERNQQMDAAIRLYEIALELQPDEDRYFLNMGRAYMEKARTLADNPAQRDIYLQQALDVLQEAQRTNPLNTDHTRNLASLHRVWAAMVQDPAQREQLLTQADAYYAEAVTLSPNNAAIWNDWATLQAERGNLDEAMETLAHSLEIDATWDATYLLRSNLAVEAGQYEIALQDYDALLAMNPESMQALSGRAFALARMERLPEAIEASQQILAVYPTDYNTHKNLALLYQQQGDYANALAAAQEALSYATPQDRPALESFIQQLSQEMSAAPAPGG